MNHPLLKIEIWRGSKSPMQTFLFDSLTLFWRGSSKVGRYNCIRKGTSRGLSSEYTPWAFFMIDTVSVHGFVPGFLDPHMSLGLLIERFKCIWKHFLRPALDLGDDCSSAKHGRCFGLAQLSAFPMHLKPRKPQALWSILIQASLNCTRETTGKRNCRSYWKPDWGKLCDFLADLTVLCMHVFRASHLYLCLYGTTWRINKYMRTSFVHLQNFCFVLEVPERKYCGTHPSVPICQTKIHKTARIPFGPPVLQKKNNNKSLPFPKKHRATATAAELPFFLPSLAAAGEAAEGEAAEAWQRLLTSELWDFYGFTFRMLGRCWFQREGEMLLG